VDASPADWVEFARANETPGPPKRCSGQEPMVGVGPPGGGAALVVEPASAPGASTVDEAVSAQSPAG
jgi:hypothetical protein